MDPNEALKNAREALAAAQSATNGDAYLRATVRLGDAFEALDGWLSTGGFLPTAWEREEG